MKTDDSRGQLRRRKGKKVSNNQRKQEEERREVTVVEQILSKRYDRLEGSVLVFI